MDNAQHRDLLVRYSNCAWHFLVSATRTGTHWVRVFVAPAPDSQLIDLSPAVAGVLGLSLVARPPDGAWWIRVRGAAYNARDYLLDWVEKVLGQRPRRGTLL